MVAWSESICTHWKFCSLCKELQHETIHFFPSLHSISIQMWWQICDLFRVHTREKKKPPRNVCQCHNIFLMPFPYFDWPKTFCHFRQKLTDTVAYMFLNSYQKIAIRCIILMDHMSMEIIDNKYMLYLILNCLCNDVNVSHSVIAVNGNKNTDTKKWIERFVGD